MSWFVLLASAGFGLVAALVLAASPNAILTEPGFREGDAPLAIRLWGVTWVAFSLLALALLLIPYRAGERWAYYAAALIPLLWLSHFVASPDTFHNLVIAAISAAALVVSYRSFTNQGAPRAAGAPR